MHTKETNSDTVKILELLASKICHDLISPVGAVSNGIEILEELGTDADEDVKQLIAYSAGQASAKLKTLRLAYGLGGAGTNIKIEDIHTIFGDFISGEQRLSQDWNPEDIQAVITPQKALAKMILCCLILVTEALPKGGTIRVRIKNEILEIEGEGVNACLQESFMHALEHTCPIDDLDPKLIHAYVTGLIANNYGFDIKVNNTENNFIVLKLHLSALS